VTSSAAIPWHHRRQRRQAAHPAHDAPRLPKVPDASYLNTSSWPADCGGCARLILARAVLPVLLVPRAVQGAVPLSQMMLTVGDLVEGLCRVPNLGYPQNGPAKP
jgi:hypothetical protein